MEVIACACLACTENEIYSEIKYPQDDARNIKDVRICDCLSKQCGQGLYADFNAG